MSLSIQIRLFSFLFGLFALVGCAERKPIQKKSDELIQRDSSESLSALTIKAGTFYSNDKFEEASKAYGIILALDSLDTVAIYRFAYCNAQLDRRPIAIKYWLKSATLNYKPFDSYRNLGIAYFLVDNKKSAFYFNKCLELDKSDKEVQHFLDLINKGKSNL